MNKLNICIAGLGNVGSNVVSTIIKNHNSINSKASLTLNIVGVSAKNRDRKHVFIGHASTCHVLHKYLSKRYKWNDCYT